MEPYDTSGRPQNPPPAPPQGQPPYYPPQGAPYYSQTPPQYPPQGQPPYWQQQYRPPQGGYYQQPPYQAGGYPPPYYPPQPMYRPVQPPLNLVEKAREKKAIRRMGNFIGLAIIAFVLLQNILTLPIVLFGLTEQFYSDGLFYYSFYVFLSVLGVALPFVLLGRFIKKEQPHTLYPFARPKDTLTAVLSLPIGMGVCMAANIVTNLIIKFFELFHIYLKQSDTPSAGSGLLGSSIFFIAIAVIPALCEEIGLRGVVLQSLKKYGGLFALVVSSVVFGLMHGNMVQIPFAMMVGGIIAYFVLKTNSLWPGIFIHFFNNGTSAILELVGNKVSNDKTMLIINAAVIWGWILIGVIAGGILIWRRKSMVRMPLEKGNAGTHLKNSEKFGAFFGNPGMIVAIVIMVCLTLTNIQFGSGL